MSSPTKRQAVDAAAASATTAATTTAATTAADAPGRGAESPEADAARGGVPAAWGANIERVLFSEAQLQRRVAELGAEISAAYQAGDEVVVVAMLTGAVVFMTDLVRRLTVPHVLDFMVASSYRGTQSTGVVEIKLAPKTPLAGRHVLIVEDIVDSGATLTRLREHLVTERCASVKVACLLDKKAGRLESHAAVAVDFVGFTCPDAFVVGYGLDFDQHYRGLPFIGVLKPSAYGAG